MKKKISVISICFFVILSIANSQVYDDPQNMDVNYQKEAEYPGGINNLINDIWAKMEYTDEAINALVDGEIMVSFNVNPDSTVSGVSILSGLDYGINEEFTRVLKKKKFEPAIADDNPVPQNVIIGIPIRVGPESRRKESQ